MLALDVGGSSVKAGLVQSGRLLSEVTRHPIESQAEKAVVLRAFHDLINGYERAQALAFAFPGPFDYDGGVCRIQGLSKYGELYGVDLRKELSGGRPTTFVNDAEAAIVGEARFGAGQSYARVLGVTLGTGLGSAFVVGGTAVADRWLYSEPVGDTIADEVFSIRGLRARARRWGLVEVEPEQIKDPVLWREFGTELGLFLRPFATDFGAEAVLVLGGISGSFERFGATLQEQLEIPVAPGELGPAAPLLGAAALVGSRTL